MKPAPEAMTPLSPEAEAQHAVYAKLLQGHLGCAVTLAPDEAKLAARLLEEGLFLSAETRWLDVYAENLEARLEATRNELLLRATERPAITDERRLSVHRSGPAAARYARRTAGGLAAAIEHARHGATAGR